MSVQPDTRARPGAPPNPLSLAEILFSLSRRHALPFAVLTLVIDENPDHLPHAQQSPWTRPDADGWTPLLRAIEPLLRATDVLARHGPFGDAIVFCPSTDLAGARELATRMRPAIELPGVQIGVAAFPETALTLEDLVEVATWQASTARPELQGVRPLEPGLGVEVMSRSLHPTIAPTRHDRVQASLKRAFDLAAVSFSAPLWLPLMGTIAAAIKISDPSGSVFFVQPRTGRGGRRFGMIKFRTMVPEAEAMKTELQHLSSLSWPDFKLDRDPRVTRIGRFLRKTSLDELPQLMNILKGEMSLVGPRPTSFRPETYEPWQTARLDAVPGLTGLWQVEGRTSTEFDVRLRLDLEYIERQSLSFDLWILLRTVGALLQMRGGK